MLSGLDESELDFETHWQRYATFTCRDDPEGSAYFRNKALYVHSLAVQEALGDVLAAAVLLAPSLSNPEAKYFLTFGVGRRLRMLWVSYREIRSIITMDRKEPLSLDEVGLVSRDLNVIYINIFGVFDNYAWCLKHQCVSERSNKIKPKQIGLFVKTFMIHPNLASLRTLLEPFRVWQAELKNRRDPVAHRIPLSVPPAVLNPEAQEQYRSLEDAIGAAIAKREFEEAEELRVQQGKLGKFWPYFIHHPDEGATAIYPTVPQDIGNLVKVVRRLNNFLRQP